MDPSRLAVLRHQLDVAWRLCDHHLDGLSDAECLWEPAAGSWTVRPAGSGGWVPDWVEPEPEPAPVATVGWLTWHLGFCASMAYDHAFGERRLTKEQVAWPGSAAAAVAWLRECHRRWAGALAELTEADLDSAARSGWPYRDGRPFGYVVGWFNVELTKNAAEIGQLRALHRLSGAPGPAVDGAVRCGP